MRRPSFAGRVWETTANKYSVLLAALLYFRGYYYYYYYRRMVT